MDKKQTIRCPLCHGEGTVLVRSSVPSKTRAMARKLRAKGLTYRAIAQRIGVKHPQQVKSMILAKIN